MISFVRWQSQVGRQRGEDCPKGEAQASDDGYVEIDPNSYEFARSRGADLERATTSRSDQLRIGGGTTGRSNAS